MDKQDNKPTTLEERLIGAFISAIAMACTIAALSFVFFILTAKGRYAGTHLFIEFVFSKISLFVIAAAAVLGFFLRFEIMLDIFGTLWGTNPAFEINSKHKFVILIALAVAIVIAVFLHQRLPL
jgi:hypothetical protein